MPVVLLRLSRLWVWQRWLMLRPSCSAHVSSMVARSRRGRRRSTRQHFHHLCRAIFDKILVLHVDLGRPIHTHPHAMSSTRAPSQRLLYVLLVLLLLVVVVLHGSQLLLLMLTEGAGTLLGSGRGHVPRIRRLEVRRERADSLLPVPLRRHVVRTRVWLTHLPHADWSVW